jgi:hypothetical protein
LRGVLDRLVRVVDRFGVVAQNFENSDKPIGNIVVIVNNKNAM